MRDCVVFRHWGRYQYYNLYFVDLEIGIQVGYTPVIIASKWWNQDLTPHTLISKPMLYWPLYKVGHYQAVAWLIKSDSLSV